MRRVAGARPVTSALLLTACGGGAHLVVHNAALRSSHLPCNESISTSPPPRDYKILLSGVAALPTAAKAAALQTARREGSDRATRLFAKIGLLIRNRTSFQLVVPPALIGRLSIGWANVRQRPTTG